MSSMQKFAWFNLTVIGVTILVVGALAPFLGTRALGGLGVTGFIGFGPFFFLRRRGQIAADERDLLIQRRSWVLAYSLFWVVFVLAAVVLSPWKYGAEGAVPVPVVQLSVALGFLFVYTVASIAILVQYAGGSGHAE